MSIDGEKKKEEKQTKKFLHAEEKEAQKKQTKEARRKQAKINQETERLKKIYGREKKKYRKQ